MVYIADFRLEHCPLSRALYRVHRACISLQRRTLLFVEPKVSSGTTSLCLIALTRTSSFQWHSFGRGPGCRTRGKAHPGPSERSVGTAYRVATACLTRRPLQHERHLTGDSIICVRGSSAHCRQHVGLTDSAGRRSGTPGSGQGEYGLPREVSGTSTRHQPHSSAHRQRARYGPREKEWASVEGVAIVLLLLDRGQ